MLPPTDEYTQVPTVETVATRYISENIVGDSTRLLTVPRRSLVTNFPTPMRKLNLAGDIRDHATASAASITLTKVGSHRPSTDAIWPRAWRVLTLVATSLELAEFAWKTCCPRSTIRDQRHTFSLRSPAFAMSQKIRSWAD